MRALLIRCLLLSLASLPVRAAITFHVEHGEEAVSGAEVCFYPYTFRAPLSAFGSDGEVRCFPAAGPIDVPPESFAFFLRHDELGLISAHQGIVTGAPDADAVRRLRWPVQRGVRVTVARAQAELGDGERLVLIVGESGTNRGALLPVERGRTSVIVPAGVSLLPMVIRGRRPVAVGAPIVLAAGAAHELAPIVRDGASALVVWLDPVDPAPAPVPDGVACEKVFSREFVSLLSKQPLPDVAFTDANGVVHRPALASANAANIVTTLFVFRNVAAGRGMVHVRGDRWIATKTAVQVNEREIAIRNEGVPLTLAADIRVRVAAPTAGVEPTPETCSEPASPSGYEASLRRCSFRLGDVLIGAETADRCEVLHSDAFQHVPAELHAGGVSPGELLAVLRRDGRTIAVAPLQARAGEAAVAELSSDIQYVAGTVTRRDRPVKAVVRFRTGKGATVGETGEFVIPVVAAPKSSPVEVQACDDSFYYVHRPESPVLPGGGYTIAVPANRLLVDVTDADSGARVENVTMWAGVAPTAAEDDRAAYTVPATNDGESRRSYIDSLPLGVFVRVCAEAKEYQRACSAATEISAEQQSISLALERRGTERSGRVTATGYQRLYWLTADGAVLGHSEVGAEGRFVVEQRNIAPNGFAIGVGTAPLFVTRIANAESDVLTITPPPGRELGFRVALGAARPDRTALVGIRVDGVVIPTDAFVHHQRSRGEHFMLVDAPIAVRNVLSVRGRADVILGPNPALLGAEMRRRDVFSDPALLATFETIATAGGDVVFE